MATREDIDHLKQNWLGDPTWDIEHTEGFEEHRDELLAFRKVTEARWEHDRIERLEKIAEELGCPGNLKLAQAVASLRRQIADLEDAMIEAGVLPDTRP